jgi:predicted enzyme related to lactoylglutathione lyase
MDALYPRLLVTRYTETFRFYAAVLPALIGAKLARGDENSHYANWDMDGQGVLALFERAAIATVAGTTELPVDAPRQDAAMLVLKVEDVDAALATAVGCGGTVVAPAQDRPAWGPTLRTAHLRDPEGTLIEIQSY